VVFFNFLLFPCDAIPPLDLPPLTKPTPLGGTQLIFISHLRAFDDSIPSFFFCERLSTQSLFLEGCRSPSWGFPGRRDEVVFPPVAEFFFGFNPRFLLVGGNRLSPAHFTPPAWFKVVSPVYTPIFFPPNVFPLPLFIPLSFPPLRDIDAVVCPRSGVRHTLLFPAGRGGFVASIDGLPEFLLPGFIEKQNGVLTLLAATPLPPLFFFFFLPSDSVFQKVFSSGFSRSSSSQILRALPLLDFDTRYCASSDLFAPFLPPLGRSPPVFFKLNPLFGSFLIRSYAKICPQLPFPPSAFLPFCPFAKR